ncbi:hypothetical protein ABTW24_23815 [Sphingobacterium thalpophilum]|uniref:Secreted protein n=1 Tax=Sphingobacterium thalpophilum TaxID=259 RepID=A0ABV4HKY4_9SPHI
MDTHHQHHHLHKEAANVEIISIPSNIEAGKSVMLTISIQDKGQHLPLDVVHEMKIHLLIVNEQLSWFTHIHPEEQLDGTFQVTTTFPSPGRYLLFTDYKPTGYPASVNKQVIDIEGSTPVSEANGQTKLVSYVDGYKITLVNGNQLSTDTTQGLQFAIEKDGRTVPAKEIQNYLGAAAHIVMISNKDKDFLHIHPMTNSEFPIYAEAHITKSGHYVLWVQFKTDDTVLTADFNVEVK